MAARRCSNCSTNWPVTVRRAKCPECEGRLDLISNETPMNEAETFSRLCHAAFDRFYGEREAQREERGDPSPEVLGRLEARRAYVEARKAVSAG